MPPPQSGKERKLWVFPVIVTVAAVIAAVAIAGVIIYMVGSSIEMGPAEIVSVTHTPQNPLPGEDITVIIEAKNASDCGLQYLMLFGDMWNYTQLPDNFGSPRCELNIGAFLNGTEVWYVVSVLGTDGKLVLSKNHTVQIGNVERSDITSLSISNVNHIPQNPTMADYLVNVSAEITSNATISYVTMEHVIVSFNMLSGIGSGFMYTHGGNIYSQRIDFYRYFEYLSDLDGAMIIFRIGAKDSSGNTALSEVFSFTVS